MHESRSKVNTCSQSARDIAYDTDTHNETSLIRISNQVQTIHVIIICINSQIK